MDIAKLVLEFLNTVLSPQVVAGVAVVVFFLFFREDIREVMRKIARVRLPGGGEVSISQVARSGEAPPSPEEKPPDEQPSLPENLPLTPEQAEQLTQAFEAERARAYLWEYRYLNYFLVPHTKAVLDWLAGVTSPLTYSLYDTIWLPAIPSADERRAVMDALQSHHLAQLQGDFLSITPKGREYIQWRGPVRR